MVKGTEQAAVDVARRMHQMFVCSAHNKTALPVCCVRVSSVDGRNQLLPADFIALLGTCISQTALVIHTHRVT